MSQINPHAAMREADGFESSGQALTDGAVPRDAAKDEDSAPVWKLVILWLIVALIVSCPAFGGSVINAHMGMALDFDRTVLGAGFGLCSAIAGLSAPFIATSFRYFGIRNVMLGGTAIAILAALLLITVVQTGTGFIICYGLMMGLAIGSAGLLPIQTVVARWYRGRRALAVSVVMSAGECAGIIVPPLFAWLIGATGDWRSGWWVTLGCLVIGGALIMWVIPGNLPVDRMDIEAGAPPVEQRSRSMRVYKTPYHWSVREAIRTRQFALLLLFSITTCICWVFFLAHGVVHFQDVGFASTTAASAISIAVTASFFGNGLAGLLGDRVSPHFIGSGALLLIATGIGLAWAPVGFTGLLICSAVFGFGYGAGQVCWITLLGNYFGTRSFPAIFGIFLATSSIASEVGAIGAGFAFDHLKTYAPAFVVVVAMTTLVGLLQLFTTAKGIRREPSVAADGTAHG